MYIDSQEQAMTTITTTTAEPCIKPHPFFNKLSASLVEETNLETPLSHLCNPEDRNKHTGHRVASDPR